MRSMLFDDFNNSYSDTNVSMESLTLQVNEIFRDTLNIAKEFASVSNAISELANFHEIVELQKDTRYAKKAVAISMESAFRRNHIPLHISLETEEDQRSFFRKIYDWIVEKLRAIKQWIMDTYSTAKLKVMSLFMKKKVENLNQAMDNAAIRIAETKEVKENESKTNSTSSTTTASNEPKPTNNPTPKPEPIKEINEDKSKTNLVSNIDTKANTKNKVTTKVEKTKKTIPEKTKQDLLKQKLYELVANKDPMLTKHILRFYKYMNNIATPIAIRSLMKFEYIFEVDVSLEELPKVFDISKLMDEKNFNKSVFDKITNDSKTLLDEPFPLKDAAFIPNETLFVVTKETKELKYKDEAIIFSYHKAALDPNDRIGQFNPKEETNETILKNNVSNLEFIIDNQKLFKSENFSNMESLEKNKKIINDFIEKTENDINNFRKSLDSLDKNINSKNSLSDDEKANKKLMKDARLAIVENLQSDIVAYQSTLIVIQKHLKHSSEIFTDYAAIFNKLN